MADCTIRFDFAYDGGGKGRGGTGTLSVNGKDVAEGRIDKTVPVYFSTDDTFDVGEDGDAGVTGLPATVPVHRDTEEGDRTSPIAITVELPGIEPASEIALTCGNAGLDDAKRRESRRNDLRIRDEC